MRRCSAVRVANKKGVLPGKQRVYRCRNEAIRAIRVFQDTEHPRVADGWFEVELCWNCFMRSEGSAIVSVAAEKLKWRNL